MAHWGCRRAMCAGALALAAVTMLAPPRPAGADQLCLDSNGDFAPCPRPTGRQPGPATTVVPDTGPSPSPAAASPRPLDGSPPGIDTPRASGTPRGGTGRFGWLLASGVGLLSVAGLWVWIRRRRVDTTAVGTIGPMPGRGSFSDVAVPSPAEPVVIAPAAEASGPPPPVESPPVESPPVESPPVESPPVEFPPGRPGLSRVTAESLIEVADELGSSDDDGEELVLLLPPGAVVVGEPHELVAAARLIGGICVAASPVAVASAVVAQRMARAVAEATGASLLRCHPYPHAVVGPVGALRALVADAIMSDRDADGLAEAILSGNHDVVLDTGSRLFHVLDGSGRDVAFVAGRPRVGDEHPLVLVDPTPGCQALARLMAPSPGT